MSEDKIDKVGIMELRIQSQMREIAELRAALRDMAAALETYAMTNETFPEYGDVARDTLTTHREIIDNARCLTCGWEL